MELHRQHRNADHTQYTHYSGFPVCDFKSNPIQPAENFFPQDSHLNPPITLGDLPFNPTCAPPFWLPTEVYLTLFKWHVI